MQSLLTVEEVMDWLRVSKATIRRLAAEGQLPAVKIGRQWRFAQREVEAWLKSQAQQHVEPLHSLEAVGHDENPSATSLI